jgi:uncharacterized damage-inducible protein DinB
VNNNSQSIRQILIRDLDAIKKELEGYNNSSDLWLKSDSINNSTGNLVLHICGNLQFFVGHVIGKSGYERNREQEFGATEGSIASLLVQIDQTKEAVDSALIEMTDNRLNDTYPIEVFGKPMTFSYFLTHLTGHLMYHLGQINYHRRLLAS